MKIDDRKAWGAALGIWATFAGLAMTAPARAETVDVEGIKEKYWARGDESELGVVQNRLYTKERKFQLGAFGGILNSDPFLSVRSIGASFGFHFSEYLAVQLQGWKSFASPSSALKTFESTRGATTNTNNPKGYFGAEGALSLVYGKLSLFGQRILYYDLHLLGGLGASVTETGTYLTPHLGLGQQIYLSRSLALRLDYRLMAYGEDIKEKVIPTKIGQVVGHRTNWTNAVTLGVTYLIGKEESQ